jgi:hypothetical protein
MPEFTSEIDIDPSEYVDSCSSREIKDLIEYLVEDGHLPNSVLVQTPNTKSHSRLQQDFSEKLDTLSKKYHSISKEDEEQMEMIFKRYL